jgi:hypothetical protein
MAGCDCPPLAAVNDRCTPSTIRCDGRMGRVHDDFVRYGLAVGFGSTNGDGLDPKASKAAVTRRTKILKTGIHEPLIHD